MSSRRHSCYVERVLDGDSVVVTLYLGLGIALSHVHCRLLGIDTPELAGPDAERARLAKARLAQLMGGAGPFEVEMDEKRDKYGRLLVILHAQGLDASVNDVLLREGLAVPYSGGKRT